MRFTSFVAVVALATGALGCSPSPTYRTAGGAAVGGAAGVLGGAFLWDQPNVNKKAWIRHLNRDRGWFKRVGGPDRLVIERFSACVVIARAVTKLEASRWTLPMKDFQGWYVRNINELAQEFVNRKADN